MTRPLLVFAGLAALIVACNADDTLRPDLPGPLQPTLPAPPAPSPAAVSPAVVALPACTHHWAAGASGSWFTAGNWNPASVPGSGSTTCIDAPGTYTVTLDPPNDATPVDVDGLSIGGGASGAQTLLVKGVAAIVNVTIGVDVRSNGVFSIEGFNGVVLTAGAVSNAGTLQTLGVCGGCGNATIRADLSNAGTLKVAGNGLVLDKSNGAYLNSGTIDITGDLTIPASTGNPTFTQESGSIGSTAVNTNGAMLNMLAGTFTYNGGDVQSTSRGILTLENVDVVFGPSPAGAATINMLPSATGNTFTGDIGPTQTLRMPTVGGFPTMASRTITLVGDVTNAGTIEIQPVPSTNFPILAGTGTLTNTGTLKVQGTGNDSSRVALNLANRGTMTFDGTHMRFDQPGLSYVNEATINGSGELLLDGATLLNQATGKIDIPTRLINAARLRGTGTNTTFLRAFSGSVVEPGFSPGILTLGSISGINGGILSVELGGEGAGTGYDQFQVAGQATISQGTLKITAVNDFEAGKCGQVFDIILHNSPGGIGTFANIEGLDQGGGKTLKIVYGKPAIKLVGLGAGQRVGIQTDPVSLTEGGNGAPYYLCLGQRPTANVTITPSPDAQVTVSPASLTFTPSDWEFPKAFTVTAVDDQATEGAHSGSVSHSVSSTDAQFNGFQTSPLVVNITDNDANNPPVAGSDAAQTAEDTPVDVAVLANDSDPDGDTYSVTAAGGASHGAVQVLNAGTAVRYSPASNYSGPDAFTYTLADSHGETSTGTVNVTVLPMPDPPAATDDAASTSPGSPVVVNVLSNDTDPDGDALTVSAVTQPANGTAAISGGGLSVTYTPSAGFSGSASFTYTANDGNGGTATATVTVTVSSTPTNQPPIVRNDFAATRRRNPVVVSVLANDADPDGDALTVSAVTQPADGRATISGGGQTVTYRAPAGFLGTTTFTYTVSDGRGGSGSATVWVAVVPRQLPPLPVPPPPPPTGSDLAISVQDTPDPAVVGQTVRYHVVIRNFGPAASQPTTMRQIWLASGINVTAGPGCRLLTNASGVECNVPSIPAGSLVESSGFTLTWRGASGPVQSLWEVTPNPPGSDPNLANNVAREQTTFRRLGGFAQTTPSTTARAATPQASSEASSAKFSGWAVRQ